MNYAIVDLTKTKTLGDLMTIAAAYQVQLNRDYAAHYDGDAILDVVRVIQSIDQLAPGEVPIRINAIAPDDNALGIHGRMPDGTPACDVYDDLLVKYNQSLSITGSHELLESRDDPRTHKCIILDDGSIIDHEIADRVEAESYTIEVGGVNVAVSNFNTPACFEPSGVPGEKFDHMGTSSGPNECRPGGYSQKFTADQGWVQITNGERNPYRAEIDRRGLSRTAIRAARGNTPAT